MVNGLHKKEPDELDVSVTALPVAAVIDSSFFRRTGGKTFETESLDEFYKPLDTYEGRHRYDPQFEWEPAEEKKLVRKVCSIAALPQ